MTSTEELFRLADEKGYLILPPPEGGTIDSAAFDLDGLYAIVLDAEKMSRQELRQKASHEIGHAETGSFYTRRSAPMTREKCEARANRWSWKKMIPPDQLFRAVERGIRTPWELAEEFDLPEQMIVEAVTYYRDQLQINWR